MANSPFLLFVVWKATPRTGALDALTRAVRWLTGLFG
jgi:hypothetical protein